MLEKLNDLFLPISSPEVVAYIMGIGAYWGTHVGGIPKCIICGYAWYAG